MKKKIKSFIALETTLITATALVTPLSTITSCGNSNKQVENAADKEYGITEQTYNDLRAQLLTNYKNKLSLTHDPESAWVIQRVDHLDEQLKSLDNYKDEKKNGFTSLTSAMVEFARNGTDYDGEKYNIRLNRKSNAQWSQLDTIFASWKLSFSQYMLNSDISQSIINRVMKDAESNFNDLKHDLMESCNDVLDGVIQGKQLLITCFEEVNDEIGLVSATLKLKEFLNKYTLGTKNVNDENFSASCLDIIQNDPECNFAVGNILTDKTMNKLFNITRKEDGNNIQFTSSIVKGYTIWPKLMKVTTNEYCNIHTILIDFGMVKTSYIGKYSKEKLATVTAHNYSAENWNFDDVNDNTTLAQILQKLEIVPIEFPINISNAKEKENLEKCYFSSDAEKERITFKWSDDKNNQAYESFFDNATKSGTGVWTAKLSENSLINSGLMISSNSRNYKFVKDLLSGIMLNQKKLKSPDKGLDELFLSACKVSADVKIDETNPKNKIVKIVSFDVNYSNSPYKYDDNGKLKLNNSKDYAKYQDKCINHQVSDSFFEKVNAHFNSVVHFITVYDSSILSIFNASKNGDDHEMTESELDSLEMTTNAQFISATLALAAGVITAAFTIFSIWTTNSGASAISHLVTLLLLICILLLQIVTFSNFKTKFYNPMKDRIKQEREFQQESKKSTLYIELEKLAPNYVYINDDGSFDKNEFAKAKDLFCQHNMEWMLDQYTTFSCIKTSSKLTQSWNKFNNNLQDKHLDPDSLQEFLDPWKDGGKYWVASWATSIATMFLGIVLKKWMDSEQKKFEALAAEQAKKEEEERLAREEQERIMEQIDNKIDEHSAQIKETFENMTSDSFDKWKKDSQGLFEEQKAIWDQGCEPTDSFMDKLYVKYCHSGFGQWDPDVLLMFFWELTLKKFEEKIWGNTSKEFTDESRSRAKHLRDRVLFGSNKEVEMYDFSDGLNSAPWDMSLIEEIFGFFQYAPPA